MVCTVQLYEAPNLKNPVLIEGLPGIGFVANIAALHLIRELNAKMFAEISSSSFQDLAVVAENGHVISPSNRFYYHRSVEGEPDLIIWYGDTQALTTFGQYELCGRVLDLVEEYGCKQIITLGGFKLEEVVGKPKVYCAASDSETVKKALKLEAKIMVGQIFGLAGITIGLGKLRGFAGFSLLVETEGANPDAKAAREALLSLSKFLKLKIDLSRIGSAADETKRTLESFGLIKREVKEKKKKEPQFPWFV